MSEFLIELHAEHIAEGSKTDAYHLAECEFPILSLIPQSPFLLLIFLPLLASPFALCKTVFAAFFLAVDVTV